MSDSLKQLIYLDNAAATPLDREVAAAMNEAFLSIYGNPSSLHQVGLTAANTLNRARSKVAAVLNVKETEITFTGSGTEADNLAILGLARANQAHGRHVVVSAIEHKAVLKAAEQLETEGFRVSYVKPDNDGVLSAEAVAAEVTDETILVSIIYANNEIGTVQMLADISRAIKSKRHSNPYPLFHTDACQAPGTLPVNPESLGVDAMTLNSAKIYGPKGVGILYLKEGIKIAPMIVGGGQEQGLRAGTESVPLVWGCAMALEKVIKKMPEESARLKELQLFFMSQLQANLPDLIQNGHPSQRLPGNISICLPDVEGESLLLLLNEAGICCATGSACSAADLEPSHVLKAIGRDDEIIHGSLRFSFGKDTTKEDLAYTVETLVAAVARLKSITASTVSVISKLKNHVSKA